MTENEPNLLAEPLLLPCGVVLPNRICKAALTEGLADGLNRATPRHVRLYRLWSQGGAGTEISGNVLVDRRYLERPGNVAIDGNGGRDSLRAFAQAGGVEGNQVWMQINHAGRQSPRFLTPEPVAPSAVPLTLSEKAYAPPRALGEAEIEDVIGRFVTVAREAKAAGFTGVQIHAAHGYLISEFLSPAANRRSDGWGGSIANRARLLLTILDRVRAEVGRGYPISVKLNSADFQKGGFSHEDCLSVVAMLNEAGVDLLEISGGTYDQPSMMGHGAELKESTRRREAYFLDYARTVRLVARMPVMVTGGFRTRQAMIRALASGDVDVIGLGRPMCVEPDLPRRLIAGQADGVRRYEDEIQPAKAGLGWFCLQLIRLADGQPPDTAMTGEQAIERYKANEKATAAALRDR